MWSSLLSQWLCSHTQAPTEALAARIHLKDRDSSLNGPVSHPSSGQPHRGDCTLRNCFSAAGHDTPWAPASLPPPHRTCPTSEAGSVVAEGPPALGCSHMVPLGPAGLAHGCGLQFSSPEPLHTCEELRQTVQDPVPSSSPGPVEWIGLCFQCGCLGQESTPRRGHKWPGEPAALRTEAGLRSASAAPGRPHVEGLPGMSHTQV